MKRKFLSGAFLVLMSFSACVQTNNHASKNKRSAQLSQLLWDDATYPVVVLGGGVAGFTAANYLVQANIPTVVLEGPKPGGALAQSPSVRNWPGVMDASGADIMRSLREQAEHYGVVVVPEQVRSVRFDVWPFELAVENIETSQKRVIKSLSCIVATGAEPNYLGIPGEQQYWGKGVTNCAVCDGGLCKGKDVAVVGGGDSAILEAAYLAGIARSVTLIVRKDYFRANDKKKRDQVLALPNVSVLYNTRVTQVDGDGAHVTQLTLQSDTETVTRHFNNLFLAIGARPNTAMVADALQCDEQGYIVLKRGGATSVDGIFAAGDVCDPFYKQAVTSASGGCTAALQAQAFLDDLGFNQAMMRQQPAKTIEPAKTPETGEAVTLLSDDQAIDQFLKQSKPIIIDVFAEWCMPCKKMAPIFEAMAEKYRADIACAKMDVTKVDVDRLVQIIDGDRVDGVPTLLFIKDSKEIGRLVGGMSAEQLEKNFKIMAGS